MSETEEKIRFNIPLSYVYTALMNTTLDKGVWVLFLSVRGLSLLEIGLIESVFQASMLVFGVPAGAISDIFGRKVSLILSVFAKIAGYILILASHDFWGFAAGFVLTAVSYVLYSGASESLAYDSVRIVGKETGYKKIYGNLLALTFIAAALGLVAGGFIADVSFELVYLISIAVLLGALVPALLFTETRGAAGGRIQTSVRELFFKSVRLISGNPVILYLLVISAVITVVDMTIYMYCQKYFEAMAIPVYLIGIILCVDSVFAALGARYAYKLERFSNRNVIVLIPAMILGTYLLLAVFNSPIVVVFLYIATIFVIAFWPIISELLNRRVPAENRATVLAIKSQMNSATIMIVFPVVGFLASQSSLSLAFLWLIASAVLPIAYSVYMIRKLAF